MGPGLRCIERDIPNSAVAGLIPAGAPLLLLDRSVIVQKRSCLIRLTADRHACLISTSLASILLQACKPDGKIPMEESVKLPSASYDELAKVIAGYSRVEKDASLDEIGKTIGMGRTRVSANNGFLLGFGLIEGGNKKKATPIGKKLGQAIEHNLEGEIVDLWRKIIENSDFLRNLVSLGHLEK